MAVLTVLILAIAAWVPWHSVLSVDNRTYVEMIRGVRDTGLPCLSNGPAAEFPELRARFNNVFHGRLCSAYPPLFAYAAQPAFRLGGLRGVIRFNVALFAALAWIVFWLGRRMMRDPRAAAAAAWLAVTSAPMFMMGSDASSYTLGIVLATAAIGCAIESLHARESRTRMLAFAAATGACSALALGTQFLVMPMCLAVIALLFALRLESEPPLHARADRWWLPSRVSLLRGGSALAGFVPALLITALINHARFGSFSSLGSGPCVWSSCVSSGIMNQAPGAMLKYAQPVIAWAALWAVSSWFVSSSKNGRIAVAAFFLVMLAPDSTLRTHAVGIARLAWGFVVDLNGLDMGDFWRPPDHLGVFLGPFAIRAMMQGAPAVAIALAMKPGDSALRRDVALAAAAVTALFLSLAMRAGVSTVFAVGFPFVSLRYVSPGVPILLLLAVVALRDVPWRWWHLATGIVVAIALTAVLFHTPADHAFARRVFLLRVLPASGFVALLLSARYLAGDRARWLALMLPFAAVLVFAGGVGATLGIDGRAVYDVRAGNDARVDALARVTPQRFAIVGWPPQIDTPLALRASRDIVYADLFESANWANFRTLIDRWAAEGRPIFALWPSDSIVSPWPEVAFVPVDRAAHIYRVQIVPRAQH